MSDQIPHPLLREWQAEATLTASQLIFPLFLAALSAGVAWVFYLKRGRSQSIFVVYFIFAAVDSFLTLIIYVALPMMG